MSRFLTLSFVAFSVISLAACSFNPMKLTANNDLESLSFTTLANANQSNATAIDVVFITDADVIEQMPTTSAAWFSQRGDLLNRHSLGIISIEMVPLATLNSIKLPNDHDSAVATFIYVHMLTVQPVIRIPTDEQCVNVTLAEQSVSYKTCH